MQKYCSETWKKVVEMLGCDINFGLTEKECENRKKLYGDNRIHLPGRKSSLKEILKSFFRIYILIPIIILAFTLYKQEIFMAFITGTIVISTITLKIISIHNSHKEIGYLQKLNHSKVTVIRDGKMIQINSEDLVKGDLVKFRRDSIIPADLRIISAKAIKVDEKNITGENFLKDKYENIVEGNLINIGEMNNILFKGTVIKSGEGSGIVVQTGDETELGKLLAMIVYAKNKHTIGVKLEKSFSNVQLILSLIILCFSAISYYKLGSSDTLLLSLVILQTLPVSILVVLQSFMLKKDSKNKNIDLINISTLDVIEDIEYVFLDKIGSITKEEVFVKKIYTNQNIYVEEEVDYDKDINIQRILDIVLLCNDALYNVETDAGTGDLLEIGYLRFAAKKKAYKSILNNKFRRVFEIPMESDKRIITSLNKYNKGYRANVRGNVDILIEKCKYIMVDGIEKEISQEDVERIRAIDYNFSVDGLISQGIAYRSFSYQPSMLENIESNLVFVGIIALENPLNDGVEKDLSVIKNKGITPIIFTEDNKIAAYALGKKAGLIDNTSGVISGVEMNSLTKDELTSILTKVRVFARVTPDVKAKIIGMFVKEEYEVAASGESLGDLPILSISKIGIGKGKASEIVKSLSDVFIKESYLKGFLKLFDISKIFKLGIEMQKGFLVSLLISEIVICNILQLINNHQSIGLISILFVNTIIFLPLSIIVLNNKKQISSNEKDILRSILWIGLCLFGVSNIKNGTSEMMFLLLSIMIIEKTAISTSISFRKITRELLILAVTVILMIITAGVLIIINSVTFSYYEMIRSAIILVSYGIIEFLIRKWQG